MRLLWHEWNPHYSVSCVMLACTSSALLRANITTGRCPCRMPVISSLGWELHP